MGMCFAGSLSLLAAADPRYAEAIGFVLSVGAHHDLARVSRFFAENTIERADGSTERMRAHDYGALVLVYAHVERFFPGPDAPAAADALRLWLWEQKEDARARAADLSPAGRERLLALFDRRLDAIAPELLAEVAVSQKAMATVSPHGHLGAVRAPIFLLHGAGDTVIPATELGWLAAEIPEDRLRSALISPAIQHVELQGEPGLGERWALVHFMAGVLAEASATEP
jgi:pimeloyl-ACP methyl ester carboxylesterase